MYEARRKVLWFAIIGRATVLLLQFIFNTLCPDHNADAFNSPADPSEKASLYDNAINLALGGLTRWDGQYFMHIAKYGYTYENTLAFYPLYPVVIRAIAAFIRNFHFALNLHSAMTIAAVFINFFCFVKSAVVFYDLSKIVLKKTSAAYKAAILYCINPAGIFFSAAYSESLFAYLTFYTMLGSVKSDPLVSFPLGLSCLARSNGLVSIGFPVYFETKKLFCDFASKHRDRTLRAVIRFALKTSTLRRCISFLNVIIISLSPFLLLQVYNYIIFCIPDTNSQLMPEHVLNYGIDNDLVLRGNGSREWCEAKIPMAYSYIQNRYWNVGFLRYYELKQIPNFALALPVLSIMILCIKEYICEHTEYFCTLGLCKDVQSGTFGGRKKYPSEMLVFIVHGLFLTISCVLFVHIQVSTRLICSASPLVCWYCALTMSYTSSRDENDLTYDCQENLRSKWRVFFLSQKGYTLADKLILSYFLGYLVVGCIMFPNFLPWT